MSFKIGDRVIGYRHPYGPVRGLVDFIYDDGILLVKGRDKISDQVQVCLHPKQCRRLMQKKRREIWVNPELLGAGTLQLTNRPAYFRFPGEQANLWIRFVEAKK